MATYLRMKRVWNGYAPIGDDNKSGGSGIDRWIANRTVGTAGLTGDSEGTAGIVAKATAVRYLVGGVAYNLAGTSTQWDCRGLTSIVGPQVIHVAFCADAAGATTPLMGASTGTTENAAYPNIPIAATPMAYITMDLQHLTTTEGYVWDQELGSHGTYFEGYPIAAMYEDV